MSDAKPKAAKKDSKAAPGPKYADLVKEAIATLKERNGSSLQSIKKAVGSKVCMRRITTIGRPAKSVDEADGCCRML